MLIRDCRILTSLQFGSILVYSVPMRVLVAGRNAKVLAITASTFATDVRFETAATKAESFSLLDRFEFDLVIACERLGDGAGLEVLSRVAVEAPNTLRIFAARPATLKALAGELGLFGLFRALPYPINFRKLWAALNLARGCCPESGGDEPPARRVATPEPAAPAPALSPALAKPPATSPPCTVSGRPEASAAPIPVPAQPAAAPSSAAPSSAAPAARPRRIPESEAFKRALARRNAARLEALAASKQDSVAATRGAVGNRSTRGRSRRAALFVGSGVFAAVTAAVLGFFILRADNTMAGAAIGAVASIDPPASVVRSIDVPVPPQATAWQPPPILPQPQKAVVSGPPPVPTAADLEAQADAESGTADPEADSAAAARLGPEGAPSFDETPGLSEPALTDSTS